VCVVVARQTGSSCRGGCSRGSAARECLSSTAGWVRCDPTLAPAASHRHRTGGLCRAVEIHADDIAQLLDEVRVATQPERFNAMGLQPMRSPMRWITARLRPCDPAIDRTLQWVTSGGVVCNVASTTG
jgi:hypothetical protein